MKKNLALAALAVAIAFTVLVPAIAQQRSGWLQKRSANLFVQRIVGDLNLTADQRTQIKAILQKERPAIRAILQKSEQTNAQLRARGSFDEAFVRSVAEQQTGNMTEALVEKEKVRAEILTVLSPEQQQTFNQMTDRFRVTIEERIAGLGDQL